MNRRAFIRSATGALLVPAFPAIVRAITPQQRAAVLAARPKAPVVSVSSSSWVDVTADLWETFEFDTMSQANMNANDNNASAVWQAGPGGGVSTSGNYNPSFKINTTTDTGTKGWDATLSSNPSATVDLNSYPTSQSVGLWFNVTSLTDTTFVRLHCLGEGSGVNAIYEIFIRRSGSSYTIGMEAASNSSTISISASTWYWLTALYVKNGTGYMRVYDTSANLVGSEVSVTGRDKSTFYHTLGTSNSSAGTLYLDNFVIDKTDATFPLAK